MPTAKLSSCIPNMNKLKAELCLSLTLLENDKCSEEHVWAENGFAG